MTSPTTDQMQAVLRKYLSGASSLREFDESFRGIAWDVPGTLGSEVSKLLGEILLLLAEYTAGNRRATELLREHREIDTPGRGRSAGSLIHSLN
jgi:hypothetical protein